MKTIRNILIFIGFLSFSTSCEDFLDQPPLDRIGMESYWRTTKDLENYVVKYYPRLPRWTATVSTTPYYDDITSDNITVGVGANSFLNGTNSIRTGTWIGDWDDIRSINIFFDNYNKCEDPYDAYKNVVGEAHFFKAWFYFNMLQIYGDLPWYSTTLAPDDEDLLLKSRDPRTLVVDSILIQLDKAIEILDTRSQSNHGNTAITKEAALAFKTRVALYEGSWQKYHKGTPFATAGADPDKYFAKAVSAAEELINGAYTVGIYNTGNPESDFHELFTLGDMSPVDEVLFYRAYSLPAGNHHNANHYATLIPEHYGLTWSLVSSFLGKDGTPYDYMGLSTTSKGNDFLTSIGNDCDPRLQSIVWIPGQMVFESPEVIFDLPYLDQSPTGFQPRMYARTDIGADDLDDTGTILFGYAEVLLNYAEAKYELDGTVAYTQLNLLRKRAGMPDFTVNPQSSDFSLVDYGYTISDELYEIRRERRVETPLQDLRERDWKRWRAHALFAGKRFKGYPFKTSEFPDYSAVLDENGLIDYQSDALPNGHGFRPGQDYLSSIPQTELTLNPNLTQNPGWE